MVRPRLTKLEADEERALLKAARKGDVAARDKLWLAFDEFARTRAIFHARRKGLDASEAESLASEALLWAIERFDLRRKTRFSTYLDHHLRGWMDFGVRKDHREREIDVFKFPPVKRPKARLSSHQKYDFLLGCWLRHHRDAFTRITEPAGSRNDRTIANNLWNRAPPRSQAWLAKHLGISRSAVCQRRQFLIEVISMHTGITPSYQWLERHALNNLSWYRYISVKNF